MAQKDSLSNYKIKKDKELANILRSKDSYYFDYKEWGFIWDDLSKKNEGDKVLLGGEKYKIVDYNSRNRTCDLVGKHDNLFIYLYEAEEDDTVYTRLVIYKHGNEPSPRVTY